jgi:formamidopyrimidine-DNA glycosylase
MFELPEIVTLAEQMNRTIQGKRILCGHLGNTPHKFVWYNRSREEFAQLTQGKSVGETRAKAKWLLIPLEPGYTLLLGECGGRILYHLPGEEVPHKDHLYLAFEDGSSLTAFTQMWGGMELYERGKEVERQGLREMRPTPIEPEFSFEYFVRLVNDPVVAKGRSAKGLLTQDALIPGLGNAIAQDILLRAHLHPKYPIAKLNLEQQRALYEAIRHTVHEVIEQGGRYDEVDLFGKHGGYLRLLDSTKVGSPCPACGSEIEKMQYLGGASYYCPHCQPSEQPLLVM